MGRRDRIEKKDKKKKKKTRVILAIVAGVILTLVLVGVGVYNYLDDSNFVKLKGDKSELNVSEEAEKKSKKHNVENILVLGVDKEENASDTIMIFSLDKDNKKIKVTSLLRDMYVYQGEGKANKINYAYHYGGVEGSISTINELFDLDIQKYVKVTFEELIRCVDYVGGVDIEITKKEAEFLNEQLDKNLKVKAGVNHLNGEQVLAYSRIRKIDSDAQRSQRQRNVMMAIFNKAKSVQATKLPQLVKAVSSTVETNIPIYELVNIGNYALGMDINNLEELRLPLDGTTSHFTSGVYHLNWETKPNVEALQKFVYGE